MTFLFLALLSAPASAGGIVVIDTVDNPTVEQIEHISIVGEFTSLTVASDTSWDEGLFTGYTDDPALTISLLANYRDVVSAELDQVFTTQGSVVHREVNDSDAVLLSVNDPDYTKQWHLRAASSEYTWANTESGKGVVVAVLDTGFTLTKDFNKNQVLHGKSFISGEGVADGHGHGTHCASTIAQATDNQFAASGLAREATILPVKVLSDSGSGSTAGIAAGIDWATDQGANVISMSLGGGGHSDVLKAAMDRAMKKGVIIVAAAGNSGGPHNSWPAGYPPVISVGSLGPDGKVAPYSSYPKTLDIMAPGGNKKIPGGGVFQWISFQGEESLQEWQGTSMATPHVAAAVAVLLGEGTADNQTQASIEKLLVSTATAPVDGSGRYGKGQMNLEAAVRSLKGETVSAFTSVVNSQVETPLPYPNPAGRLTFVITALAGVAMLVLQRVYKFSGRFFTVATAVAIASTGPLYILTFLPLSIPGLSFLMVPWIEIPDYLIGKGISGNPLWLSFLPLLVPFLIGTPFTSARPVVVGLLISTLSYLLIDTFAHFNPVWWMNAFGSSCWLGVNAMLVSGMLFTTTEFHIIERGKS